MYNTLYWNSNTETIISESDIDDVFETIFITILSNIQKSLRNNLGWIIY